MGDPRKQRKKYETPLHPWRSERILAEKEILEEYGLKNKKEIWKMNSVLKSAKIQAKKLVTQKTDQAKKEEKQLITKLARLGLAKADSKMEDVLGLDIRKVLDRRLQTLVLKQGLARSPRQARQFIIHGHILIDNKKVSVPSYLVPVSEETKITFSPNSKLSNAEHPERIAKKESVKKKVIKRREGPKRKIRNERKR